MKKKLEQLESLQQLDLQMDEKRQRQAVLTAEIAVLEQSLTAVQATVAERQAAVAALRSDRAVLEAALHTEQENIRRSETNMKEIRTNKEFQAVGREISVARKQVGELEEQLLQLDIRRDELLSELNSLQEELAVQEAACSNGCSEKQAAIAALQQELDQAALQREQLARGLGSNLLRRYTQLREQRRGQALADARDGSCLGCNMQLPPQLFNSLYRSEELLFCPHCQRILVLKQGQPS